jgi:hypothetical protein
MSAVFEVSSAGAKLFLCVFVSPQFKLINLDLAVILLNVISFLNVNSEISKGRGLLVMI